MMHESVWRSNFSKKPVCIEHEEYRGITLGQLKRIKSIIVELCADDNFKWEGGECGVHLSAYDVNLHHFVASVTKPATKPRDEGHPTGGWSLVEMMAEGPQKPDVFVSHWQARSA